MSGSPSRLESLAQVVRAPLLAVTFVFALLGVAASDTRPSVPDLVLVVVAAFGFHVAVYVANDIVDVEIDRTEPRRADSPLVRGTVSPGRMTAIAAWSGIAGVVVLALLSWRAAFALAVATSALVVYDVWGKRSVFPPATDLVQGVGWAALVVAGSYAVGDATGSTTWIAAYVVVAILLVNGVHGSIRDLANDQRHDASTTARLLGAHVAADGRFVVPAAVWAYGVALHLADVALLLVPLTTGESRSPVAAVVVAAGGAVCLGALWIGLRAAGDRRIAMNAGFVYIIVMMMLPGVLVADRLDGPLLVLILVVFVAPWTGSTFVRSRLSSRRVRGVTAP